MTWIHWCIKFKFTLVVQCERTVVLQSTEMQNFSAAECGKAIRGNLQNIPHLIFRKLPLDNIPHSAIRIPQNTRAVSLCRSFILNIVHIYRASIRVRARVRVSVRVKVSITWQNTITMVAFYSVLRRPVGRFLHSSADEFSSEYIQNSHKPKRPR